MLRFLLLASRSFILVKCDYLSYLWYALRNNTSSDID